MTFEAGLPIKSVFEYPTNEWNAAFKFLIIAY